MKINVNLEQCPCQSEPNPKLRCEPEECAAKPALIPCPLPRTVEFRVALGECKCTTGGLDGLPHDSDCPARPISVACTIGCETWEGSEVVDAERADGPGQPNFSEPDHMRAVALCSDRWALVKTLTTGEEWDVKRATLPLFRQRDAVFAALCDMAQADDDTAKASAAVGALLGPDTWPWGDRTRETAGMEAPSARALAAYVKHLIASVGSL